MDTNKYNLIKATNARKIVKNEHVEYLYLEYMRKLNERIIKTAKEDGFYEVLAIAPRYEIEQRVIKELNDAGYVVEKIEDAFPGVSSICIKW